MSETPLCVRCQFPLVGSLEIGIGLCTDCAQTEQQEASARRQGHTPYPTPGYRWTLQEHD